MWSSLRTQTKYQRVSQLRLSALRTVKQRQYATARNNATIQSPNRRHRRHSRNRRHSRHSRNRRNTRNSRTSLDTTRVQQSPKVQHVWPLDPQQKHTELKFPRNKQNSQRYLHISAYSFSADAVYNYMSRCTRSETTRNSCLWGLLCCAPEEYAELSSSEAVRGGLLCVMITVRSGSA